jgi:hypothetical protein
MSRCKSSLVDFDDDSSEYSESVSSTPQSGWDAYIEDQLQGPRGPSGIPLIDEARKYPSKEELIEYHKQQIQLYHRLMRKGEKNVTLYHNICVEKSHCFTFPFPRKDLL